MKALLKVFDNICEQKYRSIGFSRYGSCFVRTSADVLHAFTLKTFGGDISYTINFGVFPLCMPTPIYLDAGGYELNNLCLNPLIRYNGWQIGPDVGAQAECIDRLSKAIDHNLLPIFDVCKDCSSSLYELIRMEEKIERNRKEDLRFWGLRDSAACWQERSMFDSKKYYMALKAADWDYARRYLLFHINFCEKKLEEINKPSSQKQPEIVARRFAQKLAEHKEHIEQLQLGDFAFFRALLDFNERQMMAYIKARYSIFEELT